MRIAYTYTKQTGPIDPDFVCNCCKKQIQGGFMHFGKDTDYCISCFNKIPHHFDHKLRKEVIDEIKEGLFA